MAKRSTKHPLLAALHRALRPYQRRWIDRAMTYPLIAHLGARKIGKDHTWTSLPAVECLTARHQWNLFSATQTHATEVLRDVRNWLTYFDTEWFNATGEHLPQIHLDNTRHIELTNGSKIFSHPATLRAAVGLRGSVIFNEVGQIPHAAALYEGVYPTVSSSLRDGHQAHLIIISNACHQGHWWHRFWTNTNEQGGNSRRFVKITTTLEDMLISMGMGADRIVEIVKEEIGNLGLNAYAQWMDCKWRSSSGSFFDGTLLANASYQHLPAAAEERGGLKGCTLGYDIGRYRDPAAIAPLLLGGDGIRYSGPIWSQTGWDFKSQRMELQRQADMWKGNGGCWGAWVDGTGTQCSVVEELQRDSDVSIDPIVGIPFGYQSKWAIFSALKSAMQMGKLKIDAGDLDLHMELSAIGYGRTPSGQPRLEWGRSKDTEGNAQHGDRAVALALANHGASSDIVDYYIG